MRITEALLVTVIFCSVGCGIKGDPLPPAEQETIQKQEALTPVVPTSTQGTTEEKKKIKK